MVANYLDGVHLQTMVLNTPDGKVRVYSYANVPQNYIDLFHAGEIAKKDLQEKTIIKNNAFSKMYYKSSRKIREEYADEWKDITTISGDAFRKQESLIKQIESARSKLDLIITETTREQMSPMNYTVKTDEVHFSDLASKVLYSDEVKITDNRTKEVIAYNRDVMQLYSARLLPGKNMSIPTINFVAKGQIYLNVVFLFLSEEGNTEECLFTKNLPKLDNNKRTAYDNTS